MKKLLFILIIFFGQYGYLNAQSYSDVIKDLDTNLTIVNVTSYVENIFPEMGKEQNGSHYRFDANDKLVLEMWVEPGLIMLWHSNYGAKSISATWIFIPSNKEWVSPIPKKDTAKYAKFFAESVKLMSRN